MCIYIYTYTYITINMIVNDDHLITSINQYHAQLLSINSNRYTWMCIPPSQWFIIHCFKNYNPIKMDIPYITGGTTHFTQ